MVITPDATRMCRAALVLVLMCGCGGRDPIARLAQTRLDHRPIETRLTGFRWASFRVASEKRPTKIEPALAALAGEVFRPRKERTTEMEHAVALAQVLTNRAATAVTTLARLTDASNATAAMWNDLAAARYTTAVTTEHEEELIQALADVDTALRLQPDHPEARFNRAIIIERLGIRDCAIAAWKRFLAVDSQSEWATEARGRLDHLTRRDPDFRAVFDRDYARLERDPQVVKALVATYRQDSRVTAETEVLARWGEATKAGDAVAAARHLAIAAAIGAELVRTGGEPVVDRAVAVIRKSDGSKRALLAEGHVDFRAAQQTFRSGRPGAAEPMFRKAARELSDGGSAVAFVARFFAGYMRYEQGQVQESTVELRQLLAEIPSELLTVRARVQWQLAICRGAEGGWGDAIEFARQSVDNFESAGEKYYAAVLREHVAEGFQLIGDHTTAWSYRAAALREIGRNSNRFLQAILGFMVQNAILRDDWAQASSFADLELEVAQKARFQPVLADAHLRRARIARHFGSGDPANEIARARITIGAIPDEGMRSRLHARLVAVEAMVADTPAESAALLTSAIEFHQSAHGQRMFLPTLLFHRARAHRALGRTSAARRDLDEALGELDAGRNALASAEQRTGIFESAEAIVDEAIDLALAQRDVAGAFAYSERARGRAVLDVFRSRAPEMHSATLPAETAVLEFATTAPRAVIFVADQSAIRVAIRPVNGADLARRASAFTEALSRGANADAVGATLYRDLIAPVEPWIAGKDTVVIVADAATRTIPFAALRVASGRFLIEKHTLITAPSAAVYMYATARRTMTGSVDSALIVVNDASDVGSLETLPRTADEARRIALLYRDVRTLANEAATRLAFVREASRADLIHFAGHALSSEYSPEETSIVLAGPDGRMSAGDIAALQLRCSTVVLSACGTARGKARRFEGNLSVARAFLAAGVPSVVATLWPVDDAEAAAFFPLIHEQLARGRTPAEALREAQLQFISKARPLSSWASVQVIGS